jgi:hypothetical protein
MKKYFWRLGCVEARIRSDARRADRPTDAANNILRRSITDVAGCWSASSIVPNGANTRPINYRLTDGADIKLKTINRITCFAKIGEARIETTPRP